MQEVSALLNDWTYDPIHNVYWGRIYGDRKRRWRDGQMIHTSYVGPPSRGKVEGDIVETLNSKYLLGAPYDENEH